MLSRRHFCGCLVSTGLAATTLPKMAFANHDECAPFSEAMQAATSPQDAINMLMEGYARFSSGQSLKCDLAAQVHGTEAKQTPFACVLGCIDSRVPPEVVLDQQIGDIFVARVAGNYPNNDILGSFEYATKVAGAKAILVLGHSSCGAIKGAVDDVKLGNLTGLLAEIMPAVEETHLEGERSSKNHEFVEHVAEANVKRAIKLMTENSEVLKGLVDEGKLLIAGAMHDVHSGKITFLTDHG
jgi:carbonic anhydrase